MTSFPEKVRELTEKAKKLESMEDVKGRVQDFKALGPEASSNVAKVKEALDDLGFFKTNHIRLYPTDNPPNIGPAISALKKIRERFDAKADAQSLKQGQDWERLGKLLSGLETDISQWLNKCWGSFVDGEIQKSADPQELETNIALGEENPKNQENFAKYKSSYDQLCEYRGQRGEDKDDIKAVKDLAKELNRIYGMLDKDPLPEDVKAFQEAIKGGGAGLTLVTEEVEKYLKDNGTFEKYHVKRKRGNFDE